MASQMVPLRTIKPPTTREWLKLVMWIPVAVFITDNVAGLVSVEGASMTPTLNRDWPRHTTRDWIFLDKWHVTWRKPWSRGDIVTLWSPTSSEKRLTVKRIIGLEGDTIETLPPYPRKFVTLEPGQVWVEGDNPEQSKDSNTYGPIPLALLHSRAASIIYPQRASLRPSPTNTHASSASSATKGTGPRDTWEQASRVFTPGMGKGAHTARSGRAPGAGGGGVGWGGKDGLGEGERGDEGAKGKVAAGVAKKLV